ncbi:MAG: MetQ/NlpA family ABC transporter substrate-binding protein [Actinomycetaceae bacterium]|nr:MetQ/NlpA family ABC transporter substrate-binding protein [Actinomycetaceae bacterium]MDY5855335.1 MetQ/NlpA family ABC transporter substrate-binding protein [Arcanobacterium sp.]
MTNKIFKIVALAASSVLALAACSTNAPESGKTAEGDGVVTLTVGATPVPHEDILNFVKDNLAKDAGIDLKIVQYNDYVQPNTAVDAGELDANYFQHIDYLDDFNAQNGTKLAHGEPIHIEPLGIYSQKHKDLKAIPDGAEVVIPNDTSNQARALNLLADNGFFTLASGVDLPSPTDIASNPKNIKVTPGDAANLTGLVGSVDFAVINSNFAAAANLVPSEDSLAIESVENNPYGNVLAWNPDSKKLDAIKKLDDLLHSDQVKKYIEEYSTSQDDSGQKVETKPWLYPAF